jgi:hypothetical protein
MQHVATTLDWIVLGLFVSFVVACFIGDMIHTYGRDRDEPDDR